ncbi:hypothetical protein [Nitrospirillum viridazoti]|uniref:hypothetical protein n=1 Tax=Nitrospirillum viridazoti TaxID=3144925 RepID=UPI00110FF59D|nr:hypothetical protein [Nitrospirillum amazonense]
MDDRLIVLNLILQALGEEPNIDGVENRLRLQKVVYLTQIAGVELGYNYSWYLKGPYSPSLTKDYYELNNLLGNGDKSSDEKKLNDSVLGRLARIREMIAKPSEFTRESSYWYELLASIHFLSKTSKYDERKVSEVIKNTKPHLSDFIDLGWSRLRSAGLV